MAQQDSILVVEGGGLRGAFTAGVLAELHRHGAAAFDRCYATSAGAPSAAYLLTGQIEDAVCIWEHFTSGSQLVAPERLLQGRSLMDLDRLVAVFERVIPLRRERLTQSRAVFVTVTHCNTAEPLYLRLTEENAFALLKASMALPWVYGPAVDVEDMPCIDGGLTDSIPLVEALRQSAAQVTVVLTQPLGYRKKPAPMMAAFLSHHYRAYPALRRAFAERNLAYNRNLEQLELLEKEGRISVIRPASALPASRMSRDRDCIVATLDAGRIAARSWLAR